MKRIIIYAISLQLILYCFTVKAQNWTSLDSGVEGAVRYIYADTSDNSLLVCGNITHVNGITAWSFVKWDGTSWDLSMQNPFGNSQPALRITKYNNEIYVGGNGLKKWGGSNWISIYTNQPSIVVALSVINNELYVGGGFDSIDNIAAKNVAKWDGGTWSSLNFPFANSSIYAIAYYNNELYVGGNFYNHANPNDSMRNILRYDGISWKSVGSGMQGGMDDVNSLAVYNNELYVAGSFTKAHGNVGDYIQKWDGTNWSEVGGGVNIWIWQLMVHNGKLYAVGNFSYAGSVPAQRIALWDGTNWCSLGSVFNGVVGAIAFLNDTMYVGGNIVTIDGDTMNNIAKWIGGNYLDSCGTVEVKEIINEENGINVFPNPTTSSISIDIANSKANTISIYSIDGSLVYNQQVKNQNASTPLSMTIDVSKLAAGVYILRVVGDGFVGVRKIIKQ